ncbi:hypothetical protein [Leptolyngbya iicbica]|uniref:hypothetical protein n=1 Tax=Leptolyngbya iicbica TaxID=3161580 RepID=UPI001269933D|nr:hypothetical protein [Leptolyngbya sp. LK]
MTIKKQKRIRGVSVNRWGESKRRRNTYLTASANFLLEELSQVEGCNVSEFLERLVRGELSDESWQRLVSVKMSKNTV